MLARSRIGAGALAMVMMAVSAHAAPIGNGYSVSFLTTPDYATGDVEVVGNTVFVGVGPFGGAAQQVVRIDGGGTTVLAEDFNALGGMVYDAVNDRLIVGDNAGEQPGAITGDTIYAISDPFGSPTSPVSALGIELLAAGSVPGYSDVVLDPTDPTGNTLLVSDASGSFPPLGRLLSIELSPTSVTTIQTGLSFAAGIATDGTSLWFGDALLDFSGTLSGLSLAGLTGIPDLVTALATGIFDVEVEADGSLLVTSGGSILRIDPDTGDSETIATGFGFATGLDVGADGTLYALDGFAAEGEQNRVWVFTPIPEPDTAALLTAGVALLAVWRRGVAGGAR